MMIWLPAVEVNPLEFFHVLVGILRGRSVRSWDYALGWSSFKIWSSSTSVKILKQDNKESKIPYCSGTTKATPLSSSCCDDGGDGDCSSTSYVLVHSNDATVQHNDVSALKQKEDYKHRMDTLNIVDHEEMTFQRFQTYTTSATTQLMESTKARILLTMTTATTRRLVEEIPLLPAVLLSSRMSMATAVLMVVVMLLVTVRYCSSRAGSRHRRGEPYVELQRKRRRILYRQRSRSMSGADIAMFNSNSNHANNNNVALLNAGGDGGSDQNRRQSGVVRSRTWSRDSNATDAGSLLGGGLEILQQALHRFRLRTASADSNSYFWDLNDDDNRQGTGRRSNHLDDGGDDDDDRYWVSDNQQQHTESFQPSSQQRLQQQQRDTPAVGTWERNYSYYGPECSTLTYHTMIPPPLWADESRRLFAPDPKQWDLRRRLVLHLLSKPDINSNRNDDGHTSIQNIDGPFLTFEKEPLSSPPLPYPSWKEPNGDKGTCLLELPVSWVSVHVRPPDVAGVLDLYVKDSPRSDWQENSFDSASIAAQFQMDLLALQCFGRQLVNMYQALCLVHMGSPAFTGCDPVLHDAVFDPEHCLFHKSRRLCTSGVPWDDLMRCLGSHFPVLRRRLDALWWHQVGALSMSSTPAAVGDSSANGRSGRHQPQRNSKELGNNSNAPTAPLSAPKRTMVADKSAASRDEASTVGGNGSAILTNDDVVSQAERILLAPEYAGKRFMLGMVDFFRLFVPFVPLIAVPRSTSTPGRVEQLLRWRKRVARAALLVQAYVRARRVSNQGWRLERPLPSFALRKRLAHDDDLDNKLHDDNVKNEYYEASVSRDILCQVSSTDNRRRPSWWQTWLGNCSAPTLSGYQGYALVGIHCFQWWDCGPHHPLQPHYDPVKAIPSLQALIAENSDVDFFVHGIFKEQQRVVIVKVFVRTQPKGFDVKFDRTVDRFLVGDADLRRKKLFAVLQLSIDPSKRSLISVVMLWWLSFMIRTSTALLGQARLFQSVASSDERTLIPAINVSETGDTYHFGGALQQDTTLPKNYFASTVHMDSRRNNNLITRIMLSYMDAGGLSRGAIDFTYILSGCQDDEIPERALATCRLVNTSLWTISLPPHYMYPNDMFSHVPKNEKTPEVVTSLTRLVFRIFICDPIESVLSFYSRQRARTASSSFRDDKSQNGGGDHYLDECRAAVAMASVDPFERAVNELIDILKDVRIPVRASSHSRKDSSQLYLLEDSEAPSPTSRTLSRKTRLMPILNLLTRQDIRRYLIASDCSFKVAAIRIVQSTAWQHLTFPLDTRICNIELHNGQFFQYGKDVEGSPVFYFRNTLLGPWRHDTTALIAAVLHRLEYSLREFSKNDPNVQCTLIVLMGRPFVRRNNKIQSRSASEHGLADEDMIEGMATTAEHPSVVTTTASVNNRDHGFHHQNLDSEQDSSSRNSINTDNDAETLEGDSLAFEEAKRDGTMNNPRIDPEETWHTHTNQSVMEELVHLVMTHYPERLKRALVIVGHYHGTHPNPIYFRTIMGGIMALSSIVSSKRTRDKVTFLSRYKDLLQYVDQNELVALVGGTAPMPPEAFDAK